MVDADAAGLLADDLLGPFLLTVHDELGSSVPRTSAGDEAGRELTRVMERAVKLRVPVLVESERGPNWGACK
jgi:DNA polymerase I-like protein with 3'-5' exonuclease and polymerase domains